MTRYKRPHEAPTSDPHLAYHTVKSRENAHPTSHSSDHPSPSMALHSPENHGPAANECHPSPGQNPVDSRGKPTIHSPSPPPGPPQARTLPVPYGRNSHCHPGPHPPQNPGNQQPTASSRTPKTHVNTVPPSPNTIPSQGLRGNHPLPISLRRAPQKRGNHDPQDRTLPTFPPAPAPPLHQWTEIKASKKALAQSHRHEHGPLKTRGPPLFQSRQNARKTPLIPDLPPARTITDTASYPFPSTAIPLLPGPSSPSQSGTQSLLAQPGSTARQPGKPLIMRLPTGPDTSPRILTAIQKTNPPNS